MNEKEALQKLMRFCAYRERCVSEVREKLKQQQVPPPVREKVIQHLLDEGFIDEKRYADAFVRGKFNQNQWGRKKIQDHLHQKGLSREAIDHGLNALSEHHYHKKLEELLHKKMRTTKARDHFELRQKLAQFAIRKGFESGLVWEVVKALELNEEAE